MAARHDLSDYPHPSSPTATVIMKANHGRNTAPEIRLRKLLHAAGLRYRVHLPIRIDAARPISVDIAFPRFKVAVFVDGCFWHGCQLHRTIPVANGNYWGPKLKRNIERDRETVVRLQSAGWTAMRIWEHDAPEEAAHAILDLIAARQATSRMRESVPVSG